MYAKLFTSIYQGTLRGNSHGLLVFTNLLAHCDKNGIADIHPRAIAEEVGLTVEQVRAALDVLESPDDESRSPENQGRRIVRVDEHRAWGWLVVNYVKYRAIRNEDDRREQNREAQAKWRERQKAASVRASGGNLKSADVSQCKPQSAHTEAEADTEEPPIPPKGGKSPAITLGAWLQTMKESGQKPISEDDPVFSYAEGVGIPAEFLRLAWLEFRHRYTQPEAKRYRDWRVVFRRAVRGNWLKVWFLDPASNQYGLTTVGLQAQRAHRERAQA